MTNFSKDQKVPFKGRDVEESPRHEVAWCVWSPLHAFTENVMMVLRIQHLDHNTTNRDRSM